MSIAQWVESLGGFAQKQQLVALGATDRALTAAVRSGAVRRARQGWYSTVSASDPRFLAMRCGGRLTGLSAIRAEGGWVLDRHGSLHVSVQRNASRLRSPLNRRVALTKQGRVGVRVHWDEAELGSRGSASSVALRDALARVILDESLETAVAALDWALHTARIDLLDLERILLALPKRFRFIRGWVDSRCESLPESLCRTRLRLLGHNVSSQVLLSTAERIDVVIDGVVGLETDGEEFHWDRFLSDRLKDMEIMLAGFVPVRLPAQVVFHHWPRAAAAIEAALRLRQAEHSGTAGGMGSPDPEKAGRVAPTHRARDGTS